MIALLLSAMLLAPVPAKKVVHQASTVNVGAFISRDLEDGPTMLGAELLGRVGPNLGIRMAISGGDEVTRFGGDALYFMKQGPVQQYLGLGMTFDRSEDPCVTPNEDAPSIVGGIQGRGASTLFAEGRYVFGDDEHGTVSVGFRCRP